jgi:FtsP/CotA-like multicopper oxidase with cupredoxin domain
MYTTLNDASTLHTDLANGTTEIWYSKTDEFREMSGGPTYLAKYNKLPTTDTLSKTHSKIGSINTVDLNKIFHLMQGETWSPNGEAYDMIGKSEAGHTSMSVGDIIKMNGIMHMVANSGFVVLA